MADKTDEGKSKTDPAPNTAGNTAELDTLKAENAKLKETLKRLAEKYPDEGIELSDADPRVGELMRQLRERKRGDVVNAAKGKIPKAKLPLVIALADSFSSASSIELSDGDEKKHVSQADLLRAVFDQIPMMVKPGRLNLSDGDDGDDGDDKAAEFSGRDSVDNF